MRNDWWYVFAILTAIMVLLMLASCLEAARREDERNDEYWERYDKLDENIYVYQSDENKNNSKKENGKETNNTL